MMILGDANYYFTTIEGGAKAFGAVCAAGVTAGGLWAAITKGIIEPRRTRTQQIKQILYQLSPNNGGSMYDAVRRTEALTRMHGAVQKADLESRPDIVVYCDEGGEIRSVSAGYTELTGLSTIDVQREGWTRAIYEADRKEVLAGWHDAVARKAVFVTEVRFVNVKTHMLTLCKSVASPMPDEQGNCLGWSARISPLMESVPMPRPDMDAPVDHAAIARELIG